MDLSSYVCRRRVQEKGRLDILYACSMEVLKHVDNPSHFLQTCVKLVKAPISLDHRSTPLAYPTNILLAENILGVVSKGTHTYSKFVQPSELTQHLGPMTLGRDRGNSETMIGQFGPNPNRRPSWSSQRNLIQRLEHQQPEDSCIVNQTLMFARRDWLTTDRINQVWITTFKEYQTSGVGVKGLRKLRASSSHA